MIDKMNASRSPSVSTGGIDIVRPLNKATVQENSGVDGATGSLASAVDHMVQQGMPIDTARVHAIRNAIADGQYPVDPMMIAEKMIAFDRSGTGVS